MTHKNWHQKSLEQRTRGDKIADGVANGMGSWAFIIIQTFFVAIWILGNSYFLFFHFDKYPFIMLNLVFSTQAAYAAPIIMMSQNRQAKRDKVQAEHQYTHQEAELTLNTKLTKEVHELTQDIHKLLDKGIK